MADEKNTATNGLQNPSQVIEKDFYRLSEKDRLAIIESNPLKKKIPNKPEPYLTRKIEQQREAFKLKNGSYFGEEEPESVQTEPRRKPTYAESLASAKARGKVGPVELPSGLMKPDAPSNVAKLPPWPNAVRGMPNSLLRTALFGAIKRGKRAYQERIKKASVEGVTVIHTGPQLDQADLDVWQHCLHLARIDGLGTRIQFTAGGFLKAIGRSTGKTQHEWLKGAFARLSSSVVEVADGKRAYFGPMLIGGARDDETGHYVIEMNPKIASLFGTDGWTGVEFEVRRALKKQPLSQWLHQFYSSHARPFGFKVETIHQLCGSENASIKGFRQELRQALERLAEATKWTCEIDENDVVNVAKTPTLSPRKTLKKLSTK